MSAEHHHLSGWEKILVVTMGVGALGASAMAIGSFMDWRNNPPSTYWLNQSGDGTAISYYGPNQNNPAHLDMTKPDPKGKRALTAEVSLRGEHNLYVETLGPEGMSEIMAHLRKVCTIERTNTPINTQGTSVGMVVEVSDASCIATKP